MRASPPSLLNSYVDYAAAFKRDGTIVLPPGHFFDSDELNAIELIQASIPEERVSSGDDDNHHIFVRRILTDKVGELPTLVHRPFSDQIIDLLCAEKRRTILAQIFDSPDEYFIRRCQMHRLRAGSYVGLHLDVESDPDNEFSVIVQFGRSFRGGQFVVHPDDETKHGFAPTYGSVLITTCKFRHEVTKVLEGERTSLVYFYSRHGGINQRDPSARCSRPGCRWCGEHLRSSVDGA